MNDITYKDGKLYRNKKIVGCLNKDTGYYMATIDGKKDYIHRWVWKHHHGDIPAGMVVRHIDHNKKNNNIKNLELSTRRDNIRRRSLQHDNVSGYNGVYRHSGKWKAAIYIKKKLHHLGYYDDMNMAIKARKIAEIVTEYY